MDIKARGTSQSNWISKWVGNELKQVSRVESPMNELLSDGLWPRLRELAKSAKRKHAAIAYVTDDRFIKFGQGDVPKNWQHCADVGLDAILTDYPLALRTTLRELKPDSD